MPPEKQNCDLTVARGPDWLLVKIPAEAAMRQRRFPLAVQLWDLMQIHCTRRIVLEITTAERLSDYALWQLIALALHLRQIDGMIRFCGLSNVNRGLLQRYITQLCANEGVIGSEAPVERYESDFCDLFDDGAHFEEGQ